MMCVANRGEGAFPNGTGIEAEFGCDAAQITVVEVRVHVSESLPEPGEPERPIHAWERGVIWQQAS